MFPDSPYASARGSFERPVPLVLVDPCVEPAVTVRINRQWIPYILGALQQLVLQATWKTDDPDALWLVQQRAMTLLSCVGMATEEPQCESACKKYAPSDPIVNWLPTNPYTDPDTVPAGYRFPPWAVLGTDLPFTGVKRGDVLTDLLRGPIVEPISSGFPRFQVTVQGPGTIEFEFVRFPTAGVALITVDANLLTAKFVDLNISLTASIGESIAEMVIPIEVTGPGEHIVEVAMVFSFTEDPPFLHFGGALRSFSLCGFGDPPKPKPSLGGIIEWEDDDLSLHCNIRIHEGKLQVTNGCDCNGNPIWADVCSDGSTLSADGVVSQDSGTRPDDGESTCYDRVLSAGASYVIPFGVKNGDVITVSNRQGSWSSNGIGWTCTDGTPFALGQCYGSRYHDGGDPDGTLYHGQLMLLVQGQMISLTDGPVTLSGISGTAQATVAGNFAMQAFGGGDISFNICVTNGDTPPVGEWCKFLDFTVSDYGVVSDGGIWTPGVGFVPQYLPTGGGNYSRVVTVHVPDEFLTGFNYGAATWLFEYEKGTFSPGGTAWISDINGVDHTLADTGTSDGPNETWVSSEVADSPSAVNCFFRSSQNVDDGVVILKGVTFGGSGANPFGANNC